MKTVLFLLDAPFGMAILDLISHVYLVGQDGVVGIATRYGLGGLGIKSRAGEIFHTRPDRPWGLPSLL